ncbi:unnamed protein product [Spirodela intermedia]|uniref:Uncharacterized protein n=1 Tax=Spirodela intermedia TaxID=51605 RepID=A0A7I8K289_SPIIN|nr:unnamed protein product [Spirodela intermedia]CAA7398816.1 unnamed protein product [Spirodela intermedia]
MNASHPLRKTFMSSPHILKPKRRSRVLALKSGE